MSNKDTEVKTVVIDGLDKNAAITKLIQSGMDFKAANKYWVDNRPERGTGFAARFYAELEKGPMTEKRLDEVLAVESANTINHRSHFNGVRELANAIHAKV